MSRRERGAALLLVLWATALLAALLAGIAATARSQSEAALYGSEHVRAELAAEAGLAHVVAGLRAPTVRDRWVPDGRPYTFDFDGARVTVHVVDASGLVDLNASSIDLLRDLFAAAGAGAGRASQLADAIAASRGGARRTAAPANPMGTRRGAGQTRGPFRSVDQLAQLQGMDPALFARLEPAVTVFSGRNFPDASYAGPLVLAALRGVNQNAAETLVKERRAHPAQRGAGNGRAVGAVANGPLVAGYGGQVERVFANAVMPDGTSAGLDVTIRLALTAAMARPYKVLDWRSAQAPY